jgi:hypothetical protein
MNFDLLIIHIIKIKEAFNRKKVKERQQEGTLIS